jgi:hypothetical protein
MGPPPNGHPRFPEGTPVLICRPCRKVGLSTVRCECGAETVRAVIFNEPPEELR